MKKTNAFLLIMLMMFFLSGCIKAANLDESAGAVGTAGVGTSAEKAAEMIDSVSQTYREKYEAAEKEGSYSDKKQMGTAVFRELEPEITAAIEAYRSLSPEEQEQLKSREATVRNWENALAEAREYDAYSGEWVDMLNPSSRFVLRNDGTYQSDTMEPGTWNLSAGAEERKLYMQYGGNFRILVDDGVTLLSEDKKLFAKASECDAYFDKHFVKVDITPENIREYIGDPVEIGYTVDEWGEPRDTSVFAARSIAIGNGLVLLGWSEDFKYEIIENAPYGIETYTYDEPYPVITCFLGNCSYSIGDRAMGTLTFVRSDYVRENTFSDSRRTVELSNGLVFKTYAGHWNDITAKYEDYPY